MATRLAAAVLIMLSWSAGALADIEQHRATFRQGWQAAERGDQTGMVQAIAALPDYSLTPYLQFELFRQRIDRVPATVMSQFLARYRDWSFHDQLERAWLRSLGERQEFDQLLARAGDSRDVEVRCHVARARIRRNQTDGLSALVRELWLSGRSRPDACDEAFAWWRRRGQPDADTAWQRFRLALDAGETGLARYLRRFIPPDERAWADRWIALAQRPHATLRQARQWRDLDHARLAIVWALERLARSDWEAADQAWRVLSRHFAWTDSHKAGIERDIALFRAVALDTGAIDSIDALPEAARDDQILAWRARSAMAQDRWPEVLASIEAMSLRAQADSRWRYWRGRALAELKRPEAML
ncbi:MAG TPA: hypothetical protein VK972_02730, partial [Wenzhouxiangella sp.]|nr:hypothetical protein [Wenzhouxiangella sp.]